MSSIIQGYEYDIFISYRQKDNKGDKWVSEFVDALKDELESTFKEEVSVYFDLNPHDGLLETHDVDASLKEKLKCLVFIPIISQTFCDPKSYAWQHEFCVFNQLAREDQFGRDIKLSNGNVASRILPVKIHDLDQDDKALFEKELGGMLRAVDFIYKEAGVNRPLKSTDSKNDNLNKTDYRNQINKVANAIKEIIGSLERPSSANSELKGFQVPGRKSIERKSKKTNVRSKLLFAIFSLMFFIALVLLLSKHYFSEKGSIKENKNNITENSKAYEWYLKAEFRLTPENEHDVDSCIFFLTKAIAADSLFALAHAELSRAYSIKNYWIDPNGGYSEKAFVEAEKSLYLNPNLAEGYFARAYCTWNFQNKYPHEKVIREYKKATTLKADMDEAYHQIAVVYAHVGLMDEAFAAIKKAVKINPGNKFATIDLASTYFFTGEKPDLEHMIDLFKQTPEHLISSYRISQWAIALITLDRISEAEDILSAGIKKDSTNIFINTVQAILLAKEGDKEGALKIIRFFEKNNLNTGHLHHAVYNLAVASAFLGDYQEAVNKLTWVAENGLPNYPLFNNDPLLISLRQFAPYNELVKKLKISWEKFRQVANE
jgi:tetratricopeptide (TPR) repeat protein